MIDTTDTDVLADMYETPFIPVILGPSLCFYVLVVISARLTVCYAEQDTLCGFCFEGVVLGS